MASDIRALFTQVSATVAAQFRVSVADCMELVKAAQVEWEQLHATHSVAAVWGQKPWSESRSS